MASIPPRAASQRRSSPRSSEGQSSSQLPRADSEAFSITSEDSQTLLLNRRPQTPEQTKTDAKGKSPQKTSTSTASAQAEDEEPRKCWICFNDETEDTPLSSDWRSPCQCALTAHESCLLDWIADMEKPSSRGRAGKAKDEILCPQCKQEIRIKRPQNSVVNTVRLIEKATNYLLFPGILGTVAVTMQQACVLHGVSTIYLIFGIKDGSQILAPLSEVPIDAHGSVILGLLKKIGRHWRLYTGLPMIPSSLLLSRTSWADAILPFMPLVFFASSRPDDEPLTLSSLKDWPPSAALSFSLLPYARSAYSYYYEKVWRPHELRWIRELQPRAGENDETQDGDDEADNEPAGRNLFQDNNVLGLDLEFIEEEEHIHGIPEDAEEDDHHHPEEQNEAHPLNAPPLDDAEEQRRAEAAARVLNQLADEADAAPAPNVPREQPRRRRRADDRRGIDLIGMADTLIGALMFPSVAAAMGELIRYTLPRSWVTPPSSGKATGFLQTRWARSLVGGCLFVTMRDAVMLYVRWKMVQSHRQRKILDWDRARKQYKEPSKKKKEVA